MYIDTTLGTVIRALREYVTVLHLEQLGWHTRVDAFIPEHHGDRLELLVSLEDQLHVNADVEQWQDLMATNPLTIGMIVEFFERAEPVTPESIVRRMVGKALASSKTAYAGFSDPSDIPLGYTLRFEPRVWSDLRGQLNAALKTTLPADEWKARFCSPRTLEDVILFCRDHLPRDGAEAPVSALEMMAASAL